MICTQNQSLGATLFLDEASQADQIAPVADKELERLLIRARETDHRLKNFIPVVLAIVKLSGQTCSSVPEFQSTLERRLRALGDAMALASNSQEDVNIKDLLRAVLLPFLQKGQLHMTGARLRLSPSRAETYAILVHELGTNAIKHGALSVPEGSVEVSWERSGANGFTFEWSERDGPQVRAPERQGFGSFLLGGVDGHPVVGGTARIDFAPEGFRYTLTAALSNTGDEAPCLGRA
ncbi:HWE histidine kinase domain-containing protein [Methylobacterium nigriterrae]|uniref:HWE histidine kinase domain-containing protein n=1 Tax=Methylobacterium nigriterrae TaxID=3127512 RepID=UPI003013B8F4